MFGLEGSKATSLAPVFSSTNSTLFQLRPPSTVLKSPRSVLGPKMCPCAATSTMSGFVGWTWMREIWPACGRPTCVQVAPASVDLQTPSPCDVVTKMYHVREKFLGRKILLQNPVIKLVDSPFDLLHRLEVGDNM